MRQVVLPFLSVSLRDFYHSASTTMIQQENLKKRLARLAAPIFIETLLIMMLGAVDTVMLSRHSDNSVAAVGVVNQIIMLTFLVFEVINLGTSVLCSQYLGARLHKQVVQVVGVSLLVNFAVGGVPAKFIKKVDPEQAKELNQKIAHNYLMYSSWYKE